MQGAAAGLNICGRGHLQAKAATCYNLHAAGRHLLQFGRRWPSPLAICTQLAATCYNLHAAGRHLLQFARSWPPPVTIWTQMAVTCYNLHTAGRHLLQFARSWPLNVSLDLHARLTFSQLPLLFPLVSNNDLAIARF
jgi:hypothetical protein